MKPANIGTLSGHQSPELIDTYGREDDVITESMQEIPEGPTTARLPVSEFFLRTRASDGHGTEIGMD